jgi:dTMP kinase
MNLHPGILIVFDGIDGAGKTTQARKLADDLTAVGETVVLSKEPTDGIYGAKLRASAQSGRLPFDEELDLFVADRQEHLREKVAPALEAGHIVILDRYFYSTLAYQGVRAGTLRDIEERIRKDVIHPDVTFWIETPPELAVLRIQRRDGAANHFEKIDDLVDIDSLFREISRSEKNLVAIDGSRSISEVYSDILAHFIDGTFKEKRCAKVYGCDDPLYCIPRLTNTCVWWNKACALRKRHSIS